MTRRLACLVAGTFLLATPVAWAQDGWAPPEKADARERGALLWSCMRHEIASVMHEPPATIRIEAGYLEDYVVLSMYGRPRYVAVLSKDDTGFHARDFSTSFARSVPGSNWDRYREEVFRRDEALRRINVCYAIANTHNLADARRTIWDLVNHRPHLAVRNFSIDLKNRAINRLRESECYPTSFLFRGKPLSVFLDRQPQDDADVRIIVAEGREDGKILASFVVSSAVIGTCGATEQESWTDEGREDLAGRRRFAENSALIRSGGRGEQR